MIKRFLFLIIAKLDSAKNLARETLRLIRVQVFYFFSHALAGVFVNVFLWQQEESFTPVIIFNLALIFFLLLSYTASGYFLRKVSPSKLIQVGIGFTLTFFLFLILLREKAINYIFWLGFLKGLGDGFYWSGFNLFQYVLTSKTNRDHYFGFSNFWLGLSQIFGPFAAGIVIAGTSLILKFCQMPAGFTGYYFLFSLVALSFGITGYYTLRLPDLSGIDFAYSDLKRVFFVSPLWRYVLAQQFVLGLWDVSIYTLMGIFAFMILTGEFQLGVYGAISNLIFSLGSLYAGNILSQEKRLKLSLLGALAFSIGMLVMAILNNFLGISAFAILTGFFGPLLSISLGTLILTTIDLDRRGWEQKYVYLLSRDMALGVARVISYLILLLLFTNFNQQIVVRSWLSFVTIFPLVIWLLIRSQERARKSLDTSGSSALPTPGVD